MKKTIIFLAIFLISCSPKVIYQTRTEYINKFQHDSIYQYKHDSIRTTIKGDTVTNWETHTIYSYLYKYKTDTLIKKDTVQVVKKEIQVKEVTKFIGWLDYILLGILLLFVLYKLLKFFKVLI